MKRIEERAGKFIVSGCDRADDLEAADRTESRVNKFVNRL